MIEVVQKWRKKPLGSGFIPYMMGISENFRLIRNHYNNRTIFKTKHTLSSLMRTPERNMHYVGLEVLRVAVMKSFIFWDMSCSPLKANERFTGTCRLHLQCRRISQA
jgi:hypothetical protein